MVDINGNSNGPATPVPDPAIPSGGLTINEIAQAEAAQVQADAERAATLAVEAEMRAAYDKQGGSR